MTNIAEKRERISYGLLVSWCLLPVIMSLFCIIVALTDIPFVALGRTEYDFSIPWYSPQVHAFLLAVHVLGIVTLLFAIYAIITDRKRIISGRVIKSQPWLLALIILLVWITISTFLANDPVRAFTGSTYLYNGLFSYFLFAGVFICAAMIRSENYRKSIIRLFCGVLTYLSILVIIQVHFETILDYSLMPDLAAVFNQHTHFGYILCMGIVGLAALFLFDEKASKSVQTIYIAGIGLQLYALLVNTTFAGYLAALVTLPVLYLFYFFSGRKYKWSVLAPTIIFLTISVVDCTGLMPVDELLSDKLQLFSNDVQAVSVGTAESFQEGGDAFAAGNHRGIIWKETVDRICERPVFGFGPDGFYGENAIIWDQSPHNEFLQMAAFSGIPSLIFYLAALILVTVYHWRRIKQLNPMILVASVMSVAYLVSSFFGNPVFNTTPYFCIFLGIMMAFDGVYVCDEENVPVGRKGYGAQKIVSMCAILIGCVAASGLLYYITLIRNNEKINEVADMEAMHNAELTARQYDINDLIGDENDYWYDAIKYTLIPVSEPAPEAYGLGGKANAAILEPFNWLNKTKIEYDEEKDYRDKVLKVHIEGAGEDMTVSMEWVSIQ